MVVDCVESIFTSYCYFRPRTTVAWNDFLDWEVESRFRTGVIWSVFNYIADFDAKFDAPLVIYKLVPNVFVMRVMELLMVYQLVDAWLKLEALKVSQNEFKVLLTNALKWFCQVSPDLVVLRRAGVENNSFVSVIKNRDLHKAAYHSDNFIKLRLSNISIWNKVKSEPRFAWLVLNIVWQRIMIFVLVYFERPDSWH